jgi:phosphoglycolate phosphatase
MKKLIIFDLDGTLVDAYGAIIKSVRITLSRFGYPLETDRAIRRAVGWGDRNLLKAFIPAPDLDRALLFYRRVHAKALKTGVRWLPHALSTLRSLKNRKIKIAIASNRPTRFTRIILGILKGRKYFDAVLCADQLRRGKPDPLILNRLIKRFGVPKKDVLFVGDMAIDVLTGQRAKVDVVAVATGSSSRAELKSAAPKAVIKNLKALTRFVK